MRKELQESVETEKKKLVRIFFELIEQETNKLHSFINEKFGSE